MNFENVQEEFSDYIEHGFEPLMTEDGSVSLTPKKQFTGSLSDEPKLDSPGEPMHSKKGAFSESDYIYSQGCQLYIDKNPNLNHYKAVSVGLGLGYNELLIAYKFIDLNDGSFQIYSYEKESFLVEAFRKRVERPSKYPAFWKPFEKAPKTQLLKIQKVILDETVYCGEIHKENLNPFFGSVLVCFDAYSSKTNGDLWDENFLNRMLKDTHLGSVLCTYAATGSLNRALKNNSYTNIHKKGFKGKRQSTCAFKA